MSRSECFVSNLLDQLQRFLCWNKSANCYYLYICCEEIGLKTQFNPNLGNVKWFVLSGKWEFLGNVWNSIGTGMHGRCLSPASWHCKHFDFFIWRWSERRLWKYNSSVWTTELLAWHVGWFKTVRIDEMQRQVLGVSDRCPASRCRVGDWFADICAIGHSSNKKIVHPLPASQCESQERKEKNMHGSC